MYTPVLFITQYHSELLLQLTGFPQAKISLHSTPKKSHASTVNFATFEVQIMVRNFLFAA